MLQEQIDSTSIPCSYYAKTLNKAQRKYPVHDQELLAIATTLNEYRIYIERYASFIVITDHRPLIHIHTQPKIGRRHEPYASALSEHMGYMKIIYRKGSDNDSDALRRRENLEDLTEEFILDNPILKMKLDEYDAGSFERDLGDLRESLLEMTHLQCVQQLVKEISNDYSQDSSFNSNILHVGLIFDPNTGLYWIADKTYVPNTLTLTNKLI